MINIVFDIILQYFVAAIALLWTVADLIAGDGGADRVILLALAVLLIVSARRDFMTLKGDN